MEQSSDQFRKKLIEQNPDVADSQEITLDTAIENAYEALDVLTDLLLIEMEDTNCNHCAKMHASSFGEMRLAFNAVAELREAKDINNETHNKE